MVNGAVPRIAVYGVGQYGSLVTRLATAKGWPVVAAFNRAGPKAGQDLGRVVGLGRDLGVIVQDTSSEHIGIDADIGVVTNQDLLRSNMDAYRRFMGAGLNVACHGGQSYLPHANDPDLAAEIEAMAVDNGVTFTGGGIWDMSRIWAGVLAAGPCTEITSLHHRSLTDPEGQLRSLTRGSAFNRPPEDFYERGLDQSPVLLAHRAIPELVLRTLGYTIVRSSGTAEPVVYDVPVATRLVPAGRFEAGVCVGVRTRLEVTTSEGVVATASIEQRMFQPGDVEHMAWDVHGTPRNRVRVERLDSAQATAGNLFNRIPDIIAAPPGIVPVTELGPLHLDGGPVADERHVNPAPELSSVDQLMATARQAAGIDIVDDDVVEPLTVLHRALAKERSQLDAEGARAFEQKLVRLLTHRLRMQRDLRRHPEIAGQPVAGPVVVMGTARSGTTKLQKALAASGDFNFLTFWMAFNWASVTGEPDEPAEARIAEADAFCRWFGDRSPDAKRGHAFETFEPEEEGVLTEASFVTPTFLGFAEIPGYGRWLGDQPMAIQLRFLRQALQYLQWQGLASADRPWLLKSPSYSARELEILEVFPDARFVMAHRSPLRTLPSMCRLVGHFRQAYGTSVPDANLLFEHAASSMEAQAALRRAHPDLPMLDLRFEDIVGDVSGVVERVYAHAGLTLTERARAAVARWDCENAMHKYGAFTYSLSDVGLDEQAIRTRMADYFTFLDHLATAEARPATM